MREQQALITREIDSEVRLGRRVAPLDVQIRIEHHDAVRQRTSHVAEALQRLDQRLAVGVIVTTNAIKRRERGVPCTPSFGHRRCRRIVEPALHPAKIYKLDDQQHQQTERDHRDAHRLVPDCPRDQSGESDCSESEGRVEPEIAHARVRHYRCVRYSPLDGRESRQPFIPPTVLPVRQTRTKRDGRRSREQCR